MSFFFLFFFFFFLGPNMISMIDINKNLLIIFLFVDEINILVLDIYYDYVSIWKRIYYLKKM